MTLIIKKNGEFLNSETDEEERKDENLIMLWTSNSWDVTFIVASFFRPCNCDWRDSSASLVWQNTCCCFDQLRSSVGGVLRLPPRIKRREERTVRR